MEEVPAEPRHLLTVHTLGYRLEVYLCHPERSRGIPWPKLKGSKAGSLDFARDDASTIGLAIAQ
jgi:hypothetical protein